MKKEHEVKLTSIYGYSMVFTRPTGQRTPVYVSAVFAMVTWLAGWVSVTCRYCIKTDKPVLKLFRPSGSPIILVFVPLAPIPNSKGTRLAGC